MSETMDRPSNPRRQDPGERHIAHAVPVRAVERNKRIASSVLAGGFAYRLFLWLLPFALVVGGALGFMDAGGTEEAVDRGGIPGVVSNAIGNATRAAQSDSWWLLAVGIPLLLWAGFTGAKAAVLIHSLVWEETPPRIKPLQSSLAFSDMVCAFLAVVAFTWWVRGDWPGLLAPVITIAPLAALWLLASRYLPLGVVEVLAVIATRTRAPHTPGSRPRPPSMSSASSSPTISTSTAFQPSPSVVMAMHLSHTRTWSVCSRLVMCRAR